MDSDPDVPRIGISACLLGEQVRYDGRDKRHAWLVERLGPRVTWVPICPEVEVGMGVPREPVDLVTVDGSIQMVAQSGRDWTEPFQAWARERLAALGPLDGYVLKSRSPSCGLERTPPGLWAQALRTARPELPLIEEAALDDPERRAAFLAAIGLSG